MGGGAGALEVLKAAGERQRTVPIRADTTRTLDVFIKAKSVQGSFSFDTKYSSPFPFSPIWFLSGICVVKA